MEGQLRSDHAIRIGRDGKLIGTLQSESLVIAGTIEGDVYAKLVEILESGHVTGTIYCEELIIAKGGKFLGESKPLENNIVEALAAPRPEPSTATPLPHNKEADAS